MTRSGVISSWVVLTAVLAQCVAAQRVPSTSDTLSPLTSRAIEAPSFNFFGESQCDGDGNLYFHTGNSGFRFGQIFELSRDGSTGRFFQPTGKFADPEVAEFSNFWVSKDGDVSLLAIGGGHNYAIQFDGNAAMKDPITLQVPDDVVLTDLSMFDNGYMWVTGHYMHKSPGHREGRGYGAILTSSGVLAKLLSAPVQDVNINESKLSEGGIASARGNLYFLGADRISVISPGGELIRKIPFSKPDRESIATKLYVSRGVLIVVLNILKKSGSDDRISRRYLVLDENTGEATHYYQPPDLGWSDVCLTPDQEMVFLTSENKKHKLVTARIW
jgi:hypothetical protein